jgi:hypothetical protein
VLRCEEDGVGFLAACFSLDALIVLLRPELGVANEGNWLVQLKSGSLATKGHVRFRCSIFNIDSITASPEFKDLFRGGDRSEL